MTNVLGNGLATAAVAKWRGETMAWPEEAQVPVLAGPSAFLAAPRDIGPSREGALAVRGADASLPT